MKMRYFFIVFILSSFPCKSEMLNYGNSNFSFMGGDYDIYIKSNCDSTILCNKVTARFVNKKTKSEFYIKNGNTENIGYGDNLRGFTFHNKNIEYSLRQPSETGDTDLSKWIFTIDKKGVIYTDDELDRYKYHEFGDFEFLR